MKEDRLKEIETLAGDALVSSFRDTKIMDAVLKSINTIPELIAEIKRLREGLEFYAEPENRLPILTGFGIFQSNFDKDAGKRARDLLEGK